jgi:hypothetical protein
MSGFYPGKLDNAVQTAFKARSHLYFVSAIFEAVPHAPMAHPVTHENVEAARKPFLSNYCYPGALLGAPTLLAIFEAGRVIFVKFVKSVACFLFWHRCEI